MEWLWLKHLNRARWPLWMDVVSDTFLHHRELEFSDSRETGCRGKNAAAVAKPLQSCPILCDPIDGSLPGSPVPGTLQARTLEWAAISFSSAWKWKMKVKSLCHVQPSVTPWTVAHQAPPSMRFSRREYWSRVPSPSLRGKNRGP